VRQALELHRQRRRWRQVTRLSLAETLRDVFCSGDENLRIVRRGVLRYWRSSSGPPASLALLSTADGRLLALIREFATVLMHSFVGELSRWKQARKRQNWALGESLYGLASVLAHQLRQIRGKCRLVS
jgi:hypothetical protein